jgi:hypothetical protein
MLPERRNLALALVVLFIVFIVPTFFITTSTLDFVTFIVCALLVSADYGVVKNLVSMGVVYFNPLKVVDGRYGMSGAWVGAAPIGYMVVSWLSASVCSFLNNSVVCVNNV